MSVYEHKYQCSATLFSMAQWISPLPLLFINIFMLNALPSSSPSPTPTRTTRPFHAYLRSLLAHSCRVNYVDTHAPTCICCTRGRHMCVRKHACNG